MIRGVHTMFYSSQADALRDFLRDKLGFTSFTDVGEGWIIFNLPEADMGVHPTDPQEGPKSGATDLSFYCDDLDQTVAALKERGVEFPDPVMDRGWGRVTFMKVPGDFKLMLYQPRYQKNK